METGIVTTLDTTVAIQRLLTHAQLGILPIVMVLRWKESRNHFQAVTYPVDKHDKYLKIKQDLAKQLNDIISQTVGKIESHRTVTRGQRHQNGNSLQLKQKAKRKRMSRGALATPSSVADLSDISNSCKRESLQQEKNRDTKIIASEGLVDA